MKKYLSLAVTLSAAFALHAQVKTLQPANLSLPNSPSFKLLDLVPVSSQAPQTPREFSLGILSSLQDNNGWPTNYSAEFTPYWWLNGPKRNVYSYLGIRRPAKAGDVNVVRGNPFAGMQFTSFSISFMKEDMLPDKDTNAQRIISGGLHTNLIRIYSKKQLRAAYAKIDAWHKAAQEDLDALTGNINPLLPPDTIAARLRAAANGQMRSTKHAAALGEQMEMKPILQVDISAAYAGYIINDKTKTGRAGVWMSVNSFVPWNFKKDIPSNFFSLSLLARYFQNNFALYENAAFASTNSFDIGGRVSLEIKSFSIGVEAIHRENKKLKNFAKEDRLIGILNYKIGKKLYLHGTYGKNFAANKKLLTSFGINWGFGEEKVELP